MPQYQFLLTRTDLKIIVASFWLIISLGLLVFMVLLLKYVIHSNSKDHIGYLPTNLRVVGPVLEEIIRKYFADEVENTNLVEPGAGFANVSNYLAQKYSWKEIVAIEDEPRILRLAKLRQRFRKSKINFVKSNVLDYEIPKNSLVYCYLLSEIVTKMNAKKLFDGSVVVTLTFNIKGVDPTEKIDIGGFQKQLFVYDFRKV